MTTDLNEYDVHHCPMILRPPKRRLVTVSWSLVRAHGRPYRPSRPGPAAGMSGARRWAQRAGRSGPEVTASWAAARDLVGGSHSRWRQTHSPAGVTPGQASRLGGRGGAAGGAGDANKLRAGKRTKKLICPRAMAEQTKPSTTSEDKSGTVIPELDELKLCIRSIKDENPEQGIAKARHIFSMS